MISVTGLLLVIAVLIVLAVLVLYAFIRRDHLKTGRVWLPLVLLMTLVATGSVLLPSITVGPFESRQIYVLLQIVALVAYGGLVSYDLLERSWRYVVGGGLLWFLITLASSFLAEPLYGAAGWITQSLVSGSVSSLFLVIGLSLMSGALLIIGFYTFYVAALPEVSNRALFWVFTTTLMIMGFMLAVSGAEVFVVLGIAATTVAYLATTYAQVSYRVFDIRNVLGLVVRFVFMITVTALAVFGALYVIDRLEFRTSVGRSLFAGTLGVLIAAAYVPIREFINFLIRHLIVGQVVDPVEATKRYSQEVSRAADINELVDLVTRALNHVLQVRKSGMLLVGETSEHAVELKVIPSGGFAGAELPGIELTLDSPFYIAVVKRQRAISQFDMEFNPDYESMEDEERAFFRSLEMSAYAPIVMDNALIGMLACGPKVNDAPIYQQDLELLVALANQTGVALRNTRLVADLRHLNTSMQELNSTLGSANDRMGKLDSVKTDFVTIASHELRTPLAQVRGYTDIIDALNDQGMLNQDQTRGLVTNLRKATERMEELIAAMLDVSQLDVNAMDLRFTKTSPESVLRMAIEPLTDAIKQRKLTLSARGLRGLPSIEADMQRLVQAFRNIITNAIKFTPDGGRIDINASFHESETNNKGDYILIAVQDTGIGLDQDDLDLIFNKFYRASDPGLHSTGTYKFMGAGPGLGLTIAKGVIEGHGGHIWVQSEGHDLQGTPGSTFYVQLPTVPPENARRVLPFQTPRDTQSKPPI